MDNSNEKPDREEFRRQTFTKDLPGIGVMFPTEFAADYWSVLNRCERILERYGPRSGEEIAKGYVNEFMALIEANMKLYAHHVVTDSGDDVHLEKANSAKTGLLSALEHEQPAKAAFFAFLLAANAFAYGDWHRYWAYSDLGAYDRNIRANKLKHRKSYGSMPADCRVIAQDLWEQEIQSVGAATSRPGEMAKKILDQNSVAFATSEKYQGLRLPTAEQIKDWIKPAAPVEVKGRRGRPVKK